jgi:hypothetical protein
MSLTRYQRKLIGTPKNYENNELVSEHYDDVHQLSKDSEEAEKEQETTMYNNLVEKQQRYFNSRLDDSFWEKTEELREKHSYEVTVTSKVKEVNWDKHEEDFKKLKEQRKQAEDIIMVGDPVKMLEAVNAFQSITVH